ncbi:MAG TPA: metallophosphoesterase [Polyangiaceae bacterium]|jgi:hypothetical protein
MSRRIIWLALILGTAAAGAFVACGDDSSGGDAGADAFVDATSEPPPIDSSAGDAADGGADDASLLIGVIGDYGVCSDADPPEYSVSCPDEIAVAALVHGWSPDAIVTVGDNSYGSGSYAQLPGDQAPYDPDIDAGKFFPTMGNHDWLSAAGDAPSLAYFHLASPRYVKAFGSLVTFYILDTDDHDDAGDDAGSAQAVWFRAALAASTTKWNVVVNHEAPYSSCGEYSYDGDGGREDFRWIGAAGADLVLSGHSHVYERLQRGNFDDGGPQPYVVMGASGAPLQGNCGVKLPGQQKAIYGTFGALRLAITSSSLVVHFVAEDGGVADTLTLTK